jgi:aminoglycoside phosphotransferase (APT) family kinase protein
MVDPVADPCDLIDRAALDAFLAGVVPAYTSLDISLLEGGASNLTYLLQTDGPAYVLRRRPLGRTAPRAHDMKREFTVLEALREVSLPIPRVIAYSEDRRVVQEPFYLMEFVPGGALHDVDAVRSFAPATGAELSRAIITTLAKLHAVDPQAVGLGGLGRPQGFVERRILSWLRQWRSVEHRDLPQVEALGDRLLHRLPPQARSALVHGDYRLGNLLVSVEPTVEITAILDWEMSTLGDPLTDLAHLLVYWEPTCGRVTHPSQRIAEHPGFLDGAALVEVYADQTGADVSQLSFYLAFEHWRAAIIKDAIHLRGVAKGDLSAEDLVLGESVALHLAEADDVLARVPASTAFLAPTNGEPTS